MDRRGFLATAGASMVAPACWAAAGAPALLAAINDRQNRSWLVGLSATGQDLFRLPIPGRGHAAAAHPSQPVAVAFARRPGDFAVIIDCASGVEAARLLSPDGRHFYGHGAFTADGRYLLTTENAYDDGEGRLGVWDAADGYKRLDDLPSGGIGPHEIIRLRSSGFAVANGGIQTHPDMGRTRLNLPTMQTNLTFLNDQGQIVEVLDPPAALRQNSIRHIDEGPDGHIAIALQWQGDPRKPAPVAAVAHKTTGLSLLEHSDTMRLKHYGGSVAVDGRGSTFYVTGPKGGYVLAFDLVTGHPKGSFALPLASGAATFGTGVILTSASGLTIVDDHGLTHLPTTSDGLWDNHCVRI